MARRALIPAADGSRKRVLIADSREGFRVLARILGDEFTLVPVHTLTDGLDLLQNAAATPQQSIDAIVCGQHFEGSQMLRFLECVKAYQPTSRIPCICCRVMPTRLGNTGLAAMREACEALGAVAYIDLPDLERDAGRERDLARGKNAGFDHHFAKPVTLERLLDALSTAR